MVPLITLTWLPGFYARIIQDHLASYVMVMFQRNCNLTWLITFKSLCRVKIIKPPPPELFRVTGLLTKPAFDVNHWWDARPTTEVTNNPKASIAFLLCVKTGTYENCSMWKRVIHVWPGLHEKEKKSLSHLPVLLVHK